MSVGEDVEDVGGDPRAWGPRFGALESPTAGRPVAAPLERCAELLGRPLVEVERAAAAVEPYRRGDGVPVWSLMLLERALGCGGAGSSSRQRRGREKTSVPGRAQR